MKNTRIALNKTELESLTEVVYAKLAQHEEDGGRDGKDLRMWLEVRETLLRAQGLSEYTVRATVATTVVLTAHTPEEAKEWAIGLLVADADECGWGFEDAGAEIVE